MGAPTAACGRTPLHAWAGDEGAEDVGDIEPHGEEWLLTIDTNAYDLLRIDVRDGSTMLVCELDEDGSRYTSSTLDPRGRLFVTYKVSSSSMAPDQLARIDPCTCEKEVIAEYGNGGAAGLSWGDDTLYAISNSQDTLFSIDPSSGATSTIGAVGIDVRNNGASWSLATDSVYMLDGGRDRLYSIDVTTGRADLATELRFGFGTVGFEIQPRSGRMYACTGDAILYEIDENTGAVSAVGSLDHSGNCGNLAAPRGPVSCVGR